MWFGYSNITNYTTKITKKHILTNLVGIYII